MVPTEDSALPPRSAQTRQTRARRWIGQSVSAIDTPALVIDLDAIERNLDRMADFARERGLRLRPHAKTHKSAELAQLQMARGAVGVCVQKTDEALSLAEAGVGNVYISNEVIAPAKLARLAQVVRDGPTHFSIAVDSLLGIERLAAALQQAGVLRPQAIDVFIEIDIGQGRCGVAPGNAALPLAQAIAAQATLRLAGLQAYHGGAQHQRSRAERDASLLASTQAVISTRTTLQERGFEVPLVTGAGTGSLVREAASGVWGELQPGSYLFMDADYAANEADPEAPRTEHALFVKSMVMSRSEHHAVCDAGHKSHAIDSGLPTVHLPAELVFANGGDEHGILRPATPGASLPALGETVWLIPGHCDPTVNLHDFYVGVRGGLVQGRVERLIAVEARGALG